MSEAPFVIYKSSAGSGKTYTLTTAYLKLALENPMAFKQILAVTFTNKATQEMKERILLEMKRIKIGVNETGKMDADLLEKFNCDEKELSQRAGAVLSAILHHYSYFSVSTIDSFFQRVIRAFAREINLQAKFDLEMDQDAVMDRLVDRLMLKVVDDPDLHRWMVEYSSEKIMEGRSWDVSKSIGDLGKNLFKEDFKQYQREIKFFLEDPENITRLRQHLKKEKKRIINRALDMRSQANAIREKNGLFWEDFAGASRSFAFNFDRLGVAKSPIPQLTDNQKTFSDDPDCWFAKASKKKDSITQAYHDGLGDLLAEFEPLGKIWITLNAVYKNFYVFGLFSYLLKALSDLKEEENIMLISDANDFLKEITAENDAPFIYEKVGNRFQHFLLDEFQDTSGFQWASFRPLLMNSLSQGKSNLLVGDVKQSIYRWRGGEMRLLMDQVEEEVGRFGLEIKQLGTNYRSYPAIVAFNNALFSTLPGMVQQALEEQHGMAANDILLKAYADVAQGVSPFKSDNETVGKVILEFLQPGKVVDDQEEDLGVKEQVLIKLPAMLRKLQDKGYKLKDMAILVRNNQQGADVADVLMAYQQQHPEDPYQYEVLSDEAMFLEKAASVQCLLAALKTMSQPEDQLSQKTMWIQWSRVFGYEFGHEIFQKEAMPEVISLLRDKLEGLRPDLMKLPLMDLVEAIAEILGFNGHHVEKAYFSGFKEAVYDFMAKNRADIGNFISWWEQNGGKRTVKVPENHNAIRILTIHKSKGLQFKVVLAPFLDWKVFDTTKDNVVWAPYFWEERQHDAIIPITLRQNLKESAFAPVYQEEQLLAYLDNLNLLYVAFTRSEEIFWGLVPYVEENKTRKMGKVPDWLSAIAHTHSSEMDAFSFNNHFDPESLVFEYGEWRVFKRMEEEKTKEQALRWKYRPWQETLKVRQVVGEFEEGGLFKKRDFGILVHALIEKAKSAADFQNELEAMYFEGSINAAEKTQLLAQWESLWQNPKFQSWFGTDQRVLTEQGILLPGGIHKRPDRMVYFDNRVEIIDFKTGAPRTSHQRQLLDYMQLVKEIEKEEVAGFICYLETGEIVAVG